jgi:large subunit ribosomal protein L4
MKLEVFDQKAKSATQVSLSPAFVLDESPLLLTQAVQYEESQEMYGTGWVKSRGDVSGGGKKPWKQKGTGRARVGSSRSPIWRSGGIVFALKTSFGKAMPKKMYLKALFVALSSKFRAKKVKLVQVLSLKEAKTRQVQDFLASFDLIGKNTLFITLPSNTNLFLSARNIPKLNLIGPSKLQVRDIISAHTILVDLDALKALETRALNLNLNKFEPPKVTKTTKKDKKSS